MPLSTEQLSKLRKGLVDSNPGDLQKLTKAALEAGGLKTGVSDAAISDAINKASQQHAYDDPARVTPQILAQELLGSEFAAKKDQFYENLYEQFVGPLEGGRRRRRKTRKGGKSRRRHTRKH
jgi:hypothetical protein